MADDSTSIVWFRQDLRVRDNPALLAAASRGGPVVPVYIWSPDDHGDWEPGGARKWWLHHSLQSLRESLANLGSRLVLRQGDPLEELRKVIRYTGGDAVFWNRRYEPDLIGRDKNIKQALKNDGLDVKSFNGLLMREPWEVQTNSGGPYKVFTPFWKMCLNLPEPEKPKPAPKRLPLPSRWPASESLDSLGLLPRIDWASGFSEKWTPGEGGGQEKLRRFINVSADYADRRDVPGDEATSRLSPHLHHGEVSIRDVYHRAKQHHAQAYIRELGWRDFAYHVLHHFPHTPQAPLQQKFADFPWRDDPERLTAWQRGRTGYPIVDAGMRELWTTGWMHNRVRMIVASFLVKDLLISWAEGARWFWDTLVDADLANNTLGWQWAGGCGADAAPYFRVFNPVLQGKKFDGDGAYVRRWCPELSRLPDPHLHAPWEAPPGVLREAGVQLGESYPEPIVNHQRAREQALEALGSVKS